MLSFISTSAFHRFTQILSRISRANIEILVIAVNFLLIIFLLSISGSDLVNEYTIRLTADREPEEKEFIDRTLPLETNNNLFSSTEKACSPDLSLTDVTESDGNAPDRPVDSRVRDHTNNQIVLLNYAQHYFFPSSEKIYIMNADTVIVGSILGAPSGKNCTARGCESNVDAQENVEEELVMHYPEQETESFLGNDVMIPVEEEGKEFHHPTTATEK
ncbi:hypothetical protein Q9233_010873 [Columba guinea]|nr:hypothetical protein Q9233_010873 [Columba guinea]